ncbi:MAG TPA: heavy metal-binding domain-containing protein [Trebonia sp.]|nr:heavy metal-binding domain-containing protein [Trebonia sp.]
MNDDATDRSTSANAMGSRLERLRGSGPWRSLLSAQEFSAIVGVGFDPVGEVLGTAVVHLGFVSRGGKCSSSSYPSARTDLASASTGPFNLLLRKRNGVRRLAISRAIEECRALGGDGIVGMKLSVQPFPAGGTEFRVQGTAVRARTAIRPAAPFTTHVSGQEFASLLRAGWVPSALVVGISMGARHDDLRTSRQTQRAAASREVSSYTRLVMDTRRDARAQLEKVVAAEGGDGVVVDEITMHIGERECPSDEGAHDHVCEAVILGTSIVSFGLPTEIDDRPPLTIMHLNSRATAGGSPTVRFLEPASGESASAEPEAEPEGGTLDRFLAARAAKRASRSGVSLSDSALRPRKNPYDE